MDAGGEIFPGGKSGIAVYSGMCRKGRAAEDWGDAVETNVYPVGVSLGIRVVIVE